MDKYIKYEEHLERMEVDFAYEVAGLVQLFCNACSRLTHRHYIDTDNYDEEVNSYPVRCKNCGTIVSKVYIPDEPLYNILNLLEALKDQEHQEAVRLGK